MVKSKGLAPEYFERVSYLIDDIIQYINEVSPNYPKIPRFILGHSMGGTLAIQLGLKLPDEFRGFVLSGPAVGLPPDVGRVLFTAAKAMSILVPKFGVKVLDVKTLCSDPEVLKEYEQDKLIWHGKVKSRVGTELCYAAEDNLNNASKFRVPYLLCQGSKDLIVDPQKNAKFHNESPSKDKTLLLYKKSMHEILLDVEKQKVMDDILKWLNERLVPNTSNTKTDTTTTSSISNNNNAEKITNKL